MQKLNAFDKVERLHRCRTARIYLDLLSIYGIPIKYANSQDFDRKTSESLDVVNNHILYRTLIHMNQYMIHRCRIYYEGTG